MSRWKEWAKIADKLEELQGLIADEFNYLNELKPTVEWTDEEIQLLLKVGNGIQIALHNALLGLKKNVDIELMVADGKNDRTDKDKGVN